MLLAEVRIKIYSIQILFHPFDLTETEKETTEVLYQNIFLMGKLFLYPF